MIAAFRVTHFVLTAPVNPKHVNSFATKD